MTAIGKPPTIPMLSVPINAGKRQSKVMLLDILESSLDQLRISWAISPRLTVRIFQH